MKRHRPYSRSVYKTDWSHGAPPPMEPAAKNRMILTYAMLVLCPPLGLLMLFTTKDTH
jgi:hypothetical protein